MYISPIPDADQAALEGTIEQGGFEAVPPMTELPPLAIVTILRPFISVGNQEVNFPGKTSRSYCNLLTEALLAVKATRSRAVARLPRVHNAPYTPSKIIAARQ